MATLDMTLVTRDKLNWLTTILNKRKLLTVDGDNYEIGKTGQRDMSGLMLMTNLDSGRLLLERDGNRAALHGVDVVVKAGSPSVVTMMQNARTGTAPMYPSYPATGRAIATIGNGTTSLGASADVYVNTQLGVVLHGATPGLTYQFSVSWSTTANWWSEPAALPGVADGDPIGV